MNTVLTPQKGPAAAIPAIPAGATHSLTKNGTTIFFKNVSEKRQDHTQFWVMVLYVCVGARRGNGGHLIDEWEPAYYLRNLEKHPEIRLFDRPDSPFVKL